ncbi:MAG: hypothetical protein ACFFEK_10670 [Candidatus Thorarchaeota archaeon]
MTFCKICGRPVVEEKYLCQYHQDALDGLKLSYEAWKKASGISWEEYIDKLCQIDETGQWVLDVAELIRSGDDLSAPT